MTTSPLRVVVILEDGLFFSGSVLDQAFDALGKRIVHVVRHTPPLRTGPDRLRESIRQNLTIGEKTALARTFALRKLARLAPAGLVPTSHRRLKSIARGRGAPFTALRDIHSEPSTAFLRRLDADVFVTSMDTILREEVLVIPRVACLNKHASLLPRHAGLLPAFQALAAGDTHAGMTIHEMTTEIDRGRILAQRSVEIAPADSVWWLTRKIYGQLRRTLEDAIAVLEGNQSAPSREDEGRAPSYHSVPTEEDWQRLRSHRRRFI